jgi:hypothetical protein
VFGVLDRQWLVHAGILAHRRQRDRSTICPGRNSPLNNPCCRPPIAHDVPMSDADRRQHERFELLAQVQLNYGPVETFVTINISAGGILLRNDRNVQLEVRDRIRIGFVASELAPAFAIDAKIVRVIAAASKPGLLAAMWSSSDATANAALSQLLWNLRKT